MINLRHYQEYVVGGVRAAFRKIRNVLAVLPTGGGKTVIFTHIAQKMSLKGKRVLILVHRVELLRQTSNALLKFDVEHGMINPLYTANYDNHVQVASVQTIIRRLNYFTAANWTPDLIIVDEAHHATAGSWRKIINYFQDANENLKVMGVTATPIRTDGQGLGVAHNGMFDELVSGPTAKWLMDEGYLVKAKVLSPPKKFDASQLKRGKGDYNSRDLENLVNKPTITGDVVSHYEEICKGVPTIVFCVSVNHTEEVAQEFRNRGYRFYAIDGTTDDETRKRVLNGLADGTVDGVCSCDLINEGTDVPAATCGILLRPTSSLSLHLQQMGRLLRPVYAAGFDLSTKEGRLAAIAASEKPYAYILDHVGNVGNWIGGEFVVLHGLPDAEHDWTLDGEKKKKRKKEMTEAPVRVQMCGSCFAVHEPAPVCPQCGHKYEIKDTKPKKVEGKLQEVTAESIAKKKEAQATGMAKSYEDLVELAKVRGFSPKWAEHVNAGRIKKIEKAQAAKAEKDRLKKSQEIEFMDLIEITDTVRNLDVTFEMVSDDNFEFIGAGKFDEDLHF